MTATPLVKPQLIDDLRWLAARWESVGVLREEYIRQSREVQMETQEILRQLADHFPPKDAS